MPNYINMMLNAMAEYPSMFKNTHIKKEKQLDAELISVPIDGLPEILLGYAAFPKTDWGRKMVAKVNPMLRDLMSSDQFLDAQLFWLDQQGQERIRKLYHRHAVQYGRGSKAESQAD